MYEAERLLMADVPLIPLYSYVTKRMVNPRLKGWQSNVMDHHYSKDMYFLKAVDEENPATPAGPVPHPGAVDAAIDGRYAAAGTGGATA